MNVKTIIAAASLAVVGAGVMVRKYYKTKADLEMAAAFALRFSKVNALQGKFNVEKIAEDKWSVEYSTETEVCSRHVAGIDDPELETWITMLVLKYDEGAPTNDLTPVMEYVEFKKTTSPALWSDVEVAPAGENKVLLTKGEKSTTVDISSFKLLDIAVRELSKE